MEFRKSVLIFMGFILSVNSSPGPLVQSMSSHPISNQLSGENPVPAHLHLQRQQQPEDAQIEMPSQKKSPTSIREFIYRHPANLNQDLQISHPKNGETSTSPGDSSPFFALSSLGDFQLSTYFSTIFWCLTLPVIVIAALVYLQRLYLPNGIMEKIRGARSLASNLDLDLDQLTHTVYQGLSSAGKWAQSNLKDFSSAIDNHQKSN